MEEGLLPPKVDLVVFYKLAISFRINFDYILRNDVLTQYKTPNDKRPSQVIKLK